MSPTDSDNPDLASELDRGVGVTFNLQRERMVLAKWVLFGLFVLTVLTFVLYLHADGDKGKDIFEFLKISVPPIVTLILTAYFKEGRD
jgi:hypothetical protein